MRFFFRLFRQAVHASALLLALQVPAIAGPPAHGIDDFTIRTWNENNGLTATRISVIEQDTAGYLWLGTDVGLVRFDGVRFVPITEVGNYTLPNKPVPALLSTKDRSLWISVVDRTAALIRFRDGKVTRYGRDQGLEGGYAIALLQDRAGVVWAGNDAGLFRFDGERWQRVPVSPNGVPHRVVALHQARDGSLWATTRHAVFRSEANGAPFVQVDVLEDGSSVWQGLTEGADGQIWVSDFSEGFRPVGVSTFHSGAIGWGVRLLHDRRGNFWVATRGAGLWRVQKNAAGALTIDKITQRDGLATDAVQYVFEDRESNIWIGTQAGLQRLTPHRVTPITDLPLARATAITPDGSVWIGSTTGLTRFFGTRTVHYGKAQGLPGRVVLALSPDLNGGLWVATERGVTRFDHERFSPLIVSTGHGDPVSRVFSITHTPTALWLRDADLSIFKVSPVDGRQLPLTDIPETFRRAVIAIHADSQRNLWFGGDDGRVGILRADGTFVSHALDLGNVTAFHEASDGSVWVGGDRGLTHVAGNRVQAVRAQHGLPMRVKSIVEDSAGVLWVGFGSGIARIEKQEIDQALEKADYRMHYRLFNTADGAAGVPVADGSTTAVRANDGRLWFATTAGVTIIDPTAIGNPRGQAHALLEAVTADAQRIDPTPGVMLPSNVSHVQFFFTALTLTDSMQVEFKYQLDGIDQGWVEAGTNRQASYANLGPGPYTFRVIASNGGGEWSDPAVLQFGINPRFYQTSWFYALCGLGLFSIVYGSWRLHGRRVRTRFALVLAERIRMSRAIHDTLLQGLAGLALQLDDLAHVAQVQPAATGERLRRIRRRVEDYIREARQSIWDLRAPEGRSFPDALREVGTRAIADRPVSLDVSVKGAPKPCSPVVEQQLLLICQEALTNAVKHGFPRRVDVELEYARNELRVKVSDDGKGFDPATVERLTGHYGVLSMRERAAQVRGRLTIASTPGHGTRVETVIPVG